MTTRFEIGKKGEDTAVDYLRKRGYRMIERNHRQRWGEIDIVSIDPEGVLVLIEVKTSYGHQTNIRPEDQMTRNKINKFARVAMIYANNYFKDRDDRLGYRLDVIAVNLNGSNCRLEHYKNISL